MTKDEIEEQKLAASAASYLEVCPGAQTFEKDEKMDQVIADQNGEVYGSGFGRVHINSAVIGKDSSGNTVGYVISVTSSDGYDGDITLSLGLSPEGAVNGISFTQLNETPGMGMRCAEPEFKDQFAGRTMPAFLLNKEGSASSEDEIDSVSGASTTSGAVVNAVNAGLDFFRTNMKGGE